jgi:hypothetical protein
MFLMNENAIPLIQINKSQNIKLLCIGKSFQSILKFYSKGGERTGSD